MTQPEELELVCQVSEISALLAGSADVDSFLSSIVGLVGTHLEAAVCSIYLYDEDTDQLVLQVNQGLNPNVVGNVRLGPGEGLVGQALQSGETICEPVASRHPAYCFVSDSSEENFESFLAVPVRRGIEAIGVVVVQREQERPFTQAEVMALRASASMLASSIENARLLGSTRALPAAGATRARPRRDRALPDRLRGRVASPGTVVGPSRRWRTRTRWAGVLAARQNPKLDAAALDRAVAATASQLDALQQQFESQLPEMEALIFTAQQLMLRDPGFLGRMQTRISPKVDAAAAVVGVAQEVCDELGQSPHAYIREKADDVRDLADRLLDHLLGAWDSTRPAYEGAVVLARDLWPTDVLRLSSERVGALIANHGGATGHTAILARSLGIPMLIVEDQALLDIPQGSELLVDAQAGLLLCEPNPATVDRYRSALQAHADRMQPAPASDRPAPRARDGKAIVIRAEINLLGELDAARRVGAEGIGLYRTEYPFLARRNFPSEQEQVGIYRRLFDAMPRQTVTVRTLDVGGDKTLRYWADDSEDNPALGLRAIRFSLRFPGIFRDQLRAILRAAAHAQDLRILLPMVTALDEVTDSRQLLQQCMEELAREKLAHNHNPKLGVLVETPAALEIGMELGAHSDFFSIGSNDLAQYMLAIDRGNHRLADRLDATHPAVMRGIRRFVNDVRPFGREISVCGKMASDPDAIPELLNMGIRHFVTAPHLVRATRALLDGAIRPRASA